MNILNTYLGYQRYLMNVVLGGDRPAHGRDVITARPAGDAAVSAGQRPCADRIQLRRLADAEHGVPAGADMLAISVAGSGELLQQGHAGNPENERADELACGAPKEKLPLKQWQSGPSQHPRMIITLARYTRLLAHHAADNGNLAFPDSRRCWRSMAGPGIPQCPGQFLS